jgi:hypothetical protein
MIAAAMLLTVVQQLGEFDAGIALIINTNITVSVPPRHLTKLQSVIQLTQTLGRCA